MNDALKDLLEKKEIFVRITRKNHEFKWIIDKTYQFLKILLQIRQNLSLFILSFKSIQTHKELCENI